MNRPQGRQKQQGTSTGNMNRRGPGLGGGPVGNTSRPSGSSGNSYRPSGRRQGTPPTTGCLIGILTGLYFFIFRREV